MGDYFDGARLKVDRAKHHIGELNSILQHISQSDFYRLVVKENIHTGRNSLCLEFNAQLPSRTALVVGDAIHNLRAALDLAVWDSVLRTGETPDDRLMFPFRKTRRDLEKAVKQILKKETTSTIGQLIIDDIKPYPGGNDALYALHSLDIYDKHKIIIPTLATTLVSGVSAEGDKGTKFINGTLEVREGRELLAINTSENLKITNKGKANLDMFFGDPMPYKGQPIIPTLNQFLKLVSETVDKFQDLVNPPL